MENQLSYLASLSYLDLHYDELQEEYGDLPSKVEETKLNVNRLKAIMDETKSIVDANTKFAAQAKVTLVELKTREEKLAKKQFKVKNNKEFDAITNEIDFIRQEYEKISEELRSNGLKEENLNSMYEEQKEEYNLAKTELKELEKEFERITTEQNEDVKKIMKLRKSYVKNLSDENLELYNRIRKYHDDAVVLIKRNSCTGCFSQVPPQKVVEIRNDLENVYTCEHCGRIIYTDDIQLDSKVHNL